MKPKMSPNSPRPTLNICLKPTHFSTEIKESRRRSSGVFLEINGFLLDTTEDAIIELFLAIADGKLSREAVEEKFAEWLTRTEN